MEEGDRAGGYVKPELVWPGRADRDLDLIKFAGKTRFGALFAFSRSRFGRAWLRRVERDVQKDGVVLGIVGLTSGTRPVRSRSVFGALTPLGTPFSSLGLFSYLLPPRSHSP